MNRSILIHDTTFEQNIFIFFYQRAKKPFWFAVLHREGFGTRASRRCADEDAAAVVPVGRVCLKYANVVFVSLMHLNVIDGKWSTVPE